LSDTFTAETATEKVGTWTITSSSRTQLAGSGAVTHTTAGTAPAANPNSWTMDWTAPPSGSGDVRFFSAVNVSDNDGGTGGDMIYLSVLSVHETNVGLAERFDEIVGQVYPNPAAENIYINLPRQSQLRVFDVTGREVLSTTASSESLTIDVSGFEKGVYYLQIHHKGQYASRTFVKR